MEEVTSQLKQIESPKPKMPAEVREVREVLFANAKAAGLPRRLVSCHPYMSYSPGQPLYNGDWCLGANYEDGSDTMI